jgi:hypothetical protein
MYSPIPAPLVCAAEGLCQTDFVGHSQQPLLFKPFLIQALLPKTRFPGPIAQRSQSVSTAGATEAPILSWTMPTKRAFGSRRNGTSPSKSHFSSANRRTTCAWHHRVAAPLGNAASGTKTGASATTDKR